ncbi:MAG: hypothetical protein FWB76_02210 [Oscillospiraceae bacterium]|nr:hypothetical protein [Oscillospiraceae bacterium]
MITVAKRALLAYPQTPAHINRNLACRGGNLPPVMLDAVRKLPGGAPAAPTGCGSQQG